MKGQTFYDYLMAYGGAILIIIVVIAALYAMGVFSIPSYRYSEEEIEEMCRDICLAGKWEYKDSFNRNEYSTCQCSLKVCLDVIYKGFNETFCNEETIEFILEEEVK